VVNSEDVQFSLANKSVYDAIWAINGLADILTFQLWNDATGLRILSRICDGIKEPTDDDGRIAG